MNTAKKSIFFVYLLIICCSSLQGGTWFLPPTDLSNDLQDATSPAISINANGYAVAVWSRSNGTNSIIQAATRAPCSSIWVPTDDISPVSQDGKNPQVAVDPAGNAVVVWERVGGTTNHVMGARLPFGSSTWIPATNNLSANSLNDLMEPHLGVDSNGNAVAVWDWFNSVTGYYEVQGSTLAFGSDTWVATSNLSPPPAPLDGNSNFSQVGVDSAGNAVAVWQYFFRTGNEIIIKGATLTYPSTTWVLTTDPAPFFPLKNDAFNPQIAVSSSGDAVAVWTRNDETFTDVIDSATLASGSSTWVPATASLSSVDPAEEPQVAINSSGDAVAVWTLEGSDFIVQGSTLTSGSNTWAPTTNLSAGGQDSDIPQVALNDQGEAFAVWRTCDCNTFTDIIQASILPSESSVWGSPKDLAAAGEVADLPDVAVDVDRGAVAIWQRSNGTNDVIQVTSYETTDANTSSVVASPPTVPADGNTTSTITVTLRGCSGRPIVGNTVTLAAGSGSSTISPASGPSDAFGRVTFKVKDATPETILYTAAATSDNVLITQKAQVTFTPPTPPQPKPRPPSHFRGEVKKNKFLNRTEVINLLFWNPSPSPSVVEYRIYEGHKIIKTVAASHELRAKIYNRDEDRSYTYKLVAVDSNGVESKPLFLTLSTGSSSSADVLYNFSIMEDGSELNPPTNFPEKQKLCGVGSCARSPC